MAEIIPGIYQLRVPIPFNPLEYTNVYLIKTDDGYLLVDAGVIHRKHSSPSGDNWLKSGSTSKTSPISLSPMSTATTMG